MSIEHLNRAKENKNDEYYTPYEEIVRIVQPFAQEFKGKIVYCNCDDENSAFYEFFHDNFRSLKLKKVIFSGIRIDYVIVYDGREEIEIQLENKGDFMNPELMPFIRECDIICTNPPFSLISKSYFDFVYLTGKRFLIMSSLLSIAYKNIFPLLKVGKVRAVGSKSVKFLNGKTAPIVWFTNFYIQNEFINTGVRYKDKKYERYSDYPNVIHVPALKDIPMDYKGIMGVPITFMEIWNPRQFAIIQIAKPHLQSRLAVQKTDAITDRVFIKRIP